MKWKATIASQTIAWPATFANLDCIIEISAERIYQLTNVSWRKVCSGHALNASCVIPLKAKSISFTDIVCHLGNIYTLTSYSSISRKASEAFLTIIENWWSISFTKTSVEDKARITRVANSWVDIIWEALSWNCHALIILEIVSMGTFHATISLVTETIRISFEGERWFSWNCLLCWSLTCLGNCALSWVLLSWSLSCLLSRTLSGLLTNRSLSRLLTVWGCRSGSDSWLPGIFKDDVVTSLVFEELNDFLMNFSAGFEKVVISGSLFEDKK